MYPNELMSIPGRSPKKGGVLQATKAVRRPGNEAIIRIQPGNEAIRMIYPNDVLSISEASRSVYRNGTSILRRAEVY